jgi:AraC-like DNA-binding protein
VGQGIKRAYLGREVYAYDAGHYLVMTSPMPMLLELAATAAAPVLTVAIEIEMALLNEVAVGLADVMPSPVGRPARGVFVARLTPEIEDGAARLLDYLGDERATRLLARHTIREIVYHVLQGPKAGALWALPLGRAGQLGRVIHYMNEHYAEPLQVGALAQMAHMSVPTFHQHFKTVTSASPLQYLKTVRLAQARLLMVQSGTAANVAARAVGYESESQFSREFRRFYGAPPHAEAVRTTRRLRRPLTAVRRRASRSATSAA